MVETSRIKLSELESNIFRPNDNTPQQSQDDLDPVTIVYTMKGKEDTSDQDGNPVLQDTLYESTTGKERLLKAETFDLAYAKQVFNGDRYRYYVKTNQRGQFYNPHDTYEGWNQGQKKINGQPVWKFREVGFRTFELYLSFLRTNNTAWLRNAERTHR